MHNRRDSGPSGLRPVEGDLRCASCFSGMRGTGVPAVDRQASGLSAWTYRMHPSYALTTWRGDALRASQYRRLRLSIGASRSIGDPGGRSMVGAGGRDDRPSMGCGRLVIVLFPGLGEGSLQSLVFSLKNADKPLGTSDFVLSTVLRTGSWRPCSLDTARCGPSGLGPP